MHIDESTVAKHLTNIVEKVRTTLGGSESDPMRLLEGGLDALGRGICGLVSRIAELEERLGRLEGGTSEHAG